MAQVLVVSSQDMSGQPLPPMPVASAADSYVVPQQQHAEAQAYAHYDHDVQGSDLKDVVLSIPPQPVDRRPSSATDIKKTGWEKYNSEPELAFKTAEEFKQAASILADILHGPDIWFILNVLAFLIPSFLTCYFIGRSDTTTSFKVFVIALSFATSFVVSAHITNLVGRFEAKSIKKHAPNNPKLTNATYVRQLIGFKNFLYVLYALAAIFIGVQIYALTTLGPNDLEPVGLSMLLLFGGTIYLIYTYQTRSNSKKWSSAIGSMHYGLHPLDELEILPKITCICHAESDHDHVDLNRQIVTPASPVVPTQNTKPSPASISKGKKEHKLFCCRLCCCC